MDRDRGMDRGMDRDRDKDMDRRRDRDRDTDTDMDMDMDKDMDMDRDTDPERDMVMSPSSQLKNQLRSKFCHCFPRKTAVRRHLNTVRLLYGATLYRTPTVRSDLVPYAYCTGRPCTVQRLYVNHGTVMPLYGTRSHRTVGVRYGHDILNRSYGDTVFQITPIRLHNAINCCEDAETDFILLSWWCPFKNKKEPWR
jgi:hypothetical protein